MRRWSFVLLFSVHAAANAQISSVFAPREQPPAGFTQLADQAFDVQCNVWNPIYPLQLEIAFFIPPNQELDRTYQQTSPRLASTTATAAPAIPPGLFIAAGGHPIWSIDAIQLDGPTRLIATGTLRYSPNMGPLSECGAHLYVWGRLKPRLNTIRLRILPEAATAMISNYIFPNNRLYVDGNSNTPCYAYLETPRVTLGSNHFTIRAHLSARSGTTIGTTCMGPGESFDVIADADTYTNGSKIGIKNVTIDAQKYRDLIRDKLKLTTYEVDLANTIRQQLARQSVGSLNARLIDFRVVTFAVTKEGITVDLAGEAEIGVNN